MANILIVGAGIVGLSAARAAVSRGHAVTVFDRGGIPNPESASFADGRLIRMHHGDRDPYVRTASSAFQSWDRLWDDLGARHYLETGCVGVSLGPDDFAGCSASAFRRLGVAYELLGAVDLERLYPQLDLPTLARGVFASPGGVLFADRVLADLAGWLAVKGARLLPDTRVTSVDVESGAVSTEGGRSFHGDLVVVAAGAWLPEWLSSEFGRVETYRQAICSVRGPERRRMAWDRSPAIVTIGRSPVYTLPPAGGRALRLGNGAHRALRSPSAGFARDATEARTIIAAFDPYLRDPQDYAATDVQVGYYAMTALGGFALSRKGRRVVVTGCNGEMFKFGPLVGHALIDAFDGRETPAHAIPWAAFG